MNRFITVFLALTLSVGMAFSEDELPEYKQWESEHVYGIYAEISEAEAQQFGYDELVSDGFLSRYFVSVTPENGVYEISVADNIGNRMWRIELNEYYMKLSMTSMLLYGDEGVLEWNGMSGFFYKKPRNLK